MQFVYDKNCKDNMLKITDENYNYIIKARRHKLEDKIYFRNLEDDFLYLYKLIHIDKKSALFELINSEKKILENRRKLHLAWCIVEPKTIYENIPYLNEIGIDKISFVYSDFSQKNFKINLEKLEKILISSSTQCGRSSLIQTDFFRNLSEFIKHYPNSYFLDFSTNSIESNKEDIQTLIIGPEGGFSNKERELFVENRVVGLNSALILKSETAIIAASSKIIL